MANPWSYPERYARERRRARLTCAREPTRRATRSDDTHVAVVPKVVIIVIIIDATRRANERPTRYRPTD